MAFNRYLIVLAGICAGVMLEAPADARCAEPILKTHTPPSILPGTSLPPDFPQKSRTVLQVKVNGVGYPDELTVVKSSGSAQLDKSAASYIGQKWQWSPGCAAKTEVAVDWDLSLTGTASR